MRLHIDDLDNRSHRHNIRMRGRRETSDQENLHAQLTRLFSMILGRPPDAQVTMDRAHRALRLRPPPSTPPRDIICKVQDFQLKMEIMMKAWTERSWRFEGQNLELYNDFSHLTLQTRRALRPVTMALQREQISYRWMFPFAQSASRGNMEATIRTHEDVPAFTESLGLPPIQVPDRITCPLNERNMGRPVSPDTWQNVILG
ncbi:Hypothetical predicted protein [Pelobates cultripes]|uniref:Uncharacterized protein n=1 Tax=Pelobates cultripes TaxID=61616 RepID=A0AAD1SHN6_PELCU|nr:Hypothetical predicted protein [Pelobates cultripes]